MRSDIFKIFTKTDILRIFEIANEALKDAEQFDDFGYKMDLLDEEMRDLKDRLSKFMESDESYLDDEEETTEQPEILEELFETYKTIADEAIELADAYAGGESETVEALHKRFEEAEDKENARSRK